MMVLIACGDCHDELDTEVANTAEAIEDAQHLGWTQRRGRWLCANCIIEEQLL